MIANSRFIGDIFSLTKPKITLMAALVAVAGILHSQKELFFWNAILSLLGISLLVSGSSALNMYLESEHDKKMTRTKNRPLPSGRIDALWAVAIGVFCTLSACFLLYISTNVLTIFLGLASLVLYVFCYTPLKQKTWFSLIIGSIPGAMPVMLGYTTLSGSIDAKAMALFLWAFLWQIPHFLAISLFREKEYTNAGFPVLSAIINESPTKIVLLITSWLLVLSTVGLYLSGVIQIFSLTVCLLMGTFFLMVCHQGAFVLNTDTWARRAFRASLIYQGLLFIALIVAAW